MTTAAQVKLCTCPECNGSGQVNLDVGKLGVDIKCIYCNGSGQVTEQFIEELNAAKAKWCDCGNPSGRADYVIKSEDTDEQWVCGDCGKIIRKIFGTSIPDFEEIE